jgi:hypothetical protein
MGRGLNYWETRYGPAHTDNLYDFFIVYADFTHQRLTSFLKFTICSSDADQAVRAIFEEIKISMMELLLTNNEEKNAEISFFSFEPNNHNKMEDK